MDNQELRNIIREQLLEYYILSEGVSVSFVKKYFRKQFLKLGKPVVSLGVDVADNTITYTARLLNMDVFKMIRYKNPSYGQLFKNGKLIKTIPGHEVNKSFPEFVSDAY